MTNITLRCRTHLISFWLEVEGPVSADSEELEPPNHDLVVTKAVDHEALDFWLATDTPPKLSLPRPQLLPSVLVPAVPRIGKRPSPIPILLAGSPCEDTLWTLKLVLELAAVTGEVRLARVAPDARCESASLVDVGDGGARGYPESVYNDECDEDDPYFGGLARTKSARVCGLDTNSGKQRGRGGRRGIVFWRMSGDSVKICV